MMAESNPYFDADLDTLASECRRMARELRTPAHTAEERIQRMEISALLLDAAAQRFAPAPASQPARWAGAMHDPTDFVDSHLESYQEQAKQIRYRILMRATNAVFGAKAQDWIRENWLGDPITKTYEIAQDSDEGLRRVLVHLAALRR